MNNNSFDPANVSISDKAFAATLLKSIIESNKIDTALPYSVKNYIDYILGGAIKKIETEMTLDMIKNMGENGDE